jgi:hypothetical protein
LRGDGKYLGPAAQPCREFAANPAQPLSRDIETAKPRQIGIVAGV